MVETEILIAMFAPVYTALGYLVMVQYKLNREVGEVRANCPMCFDK